MITSAQYRAAAISETAIVIPAAAIAPITAARPPSISNAICSTVRHMASGSFLLEPSRYEQQLYGNGRSQTKTSEYDSHKQRAQANLRS